MAATIKACPETNVVVDLQTCEVTVGEEVYSVQMSSSARNALMTGRYDFLGQLLDSAPAVQELANRVPYMSGFAS